MHYYVIILMLVENSLKMTLSFITIISRAKYHPEKIITVSGLNGAEKGHSITRIKSLLGKRRSNFRRTSAQTITKNLNEECCKVIN